jgi:hypothetical protein
VAGVAPALQQRESVHPRQPEIEYGRVIRLGAAEKLRAYSVIRDVDGVVRCLQGRGQALRQRCFVLDDQDPHQAVI